MAPTTAVLVLALLTSSSFALPFNFPFSGQPNNGFWHPNHQPHGPPNGRPHLGHECPAPTGPHGGPGWDHSSHYTGIGPCRHPEKPTSMLISSEATTSSASPTTTNAPPPIGTGFLSYTGPMYTYPLRTSTGIDYAYPSGTGFPYRTATGFTFPTGTPDISLHLPNPSYGFFETPVESAPTSLTKRFEGPRRHHSGPQQQQWQPYTHHGYHGEGDHHGPPRYGGPPHGLETPTPTAGCVASTGLIRPTAGFTYPTGGYAASTWFASPSGRPE